MYWAFGLHQGTVYGHFPSPQSPCSHTHFCLHSGISVFQKNLSSIHVPRLLPKETPLVSNVLYQHVHVFCSISCEFRSVFVNFADLL